jgi:uncharacterized protein (DUF2147 family)
MTGSLKFLAASSLAITLATMPIALADGTASLTGNWARDDGSVRMTVSPCGSNLCAVNTWVKDPNGSEKVGDRLVMTLQPESGSKLQGEAYDVRRQAHYKMTITLDGKTMQTSGCVLLGIVCKSVGWTRMD